MSVTQRAEGIRFSSDSPFSRGREDRDDEAPNVKVSILMCAFNEQRTITRAVREVLAEVYPCEIELIVVDDGSSDETADLVARFTDPRVVLHRHPDNKGKGAALKTAASLASGTHILPFDADLEYMPKDIPRLVEPIMTGRSDVVYGTRLFGVNTVYQSFRYAIGNRVLTTLTNMLFDSYLSDLHTCLKLIPLGTFKSLDLRENGFGLDTEVTAALLRLGVRPFEVPISYYSRSHAQGKKINWKDAFACLSILFKLRARRKSRLTLRTPDQDSGEGGGQAPPRHGDGPVVAGLGSLAELPILAAFDAPSLVDDEATAIAAG
jgi:dolichol-phosphate hexosyltransferase